MKAIETRYLPATARKGSRIVASDSDGNRATISYPSELREGEACHRAAAVALAKKMNWLGCGNLVGGGTKHGFAFVFVPQPDENDEGHQGWDNYETWLVWVWMDNERGVKDGWITTAGEIIAESVADKIFSRQERAMLDLGDSIKDAFESAIPDNKESFITDLTNAALSKVNWSEIALELLDLATKEKEVA